MAPAFLGVLCPVDFSEQARTAVGYGAAIADHFKAQLQILNVSPDGAPAAETLDRLESFVGRITARVGGLYPSPEISVRWGIPGDVILAAAAEHASDLIVISTHGAGAGAGAYGSTTLHLLQYAAVPMLVIPPSMHRSAPFEAERLLGGATVVIAPIDFYGRARRDARIAAGLAEAFGLELLLLHVLTAHGGGSDDARAVLQDMARELGSRVRTEALLTAGDPAHEISRCAVERNAGLIVMGLRGDGAAPGSLPGSIAYEVLREAPSLVLAIPEGRAWAGRHAGLEAALSA